MPETRELSDFRNEDQFDSRDMQERIEWLQDWVDDEDETAETRAERKTELAALLKFKEEAEGYAGDSFTDGIQFVRDSYFKDFAKELAEETGDMPKEHVWPHYCIDWEYAARELQHDYTSIELDGITFWYR